MKAIGKLADGRLCSTVPMQYAVVAALQGDRSHQVAFRAALAERGAITASSLNAIPGITCVAPTAAFYVMPKVELPKGRTDEDYVLGLLRATGVLCVYGSGFGTAGRGRLPADRVPGITRGTARNLRADGGLHERVPGADALAPFLMTIPA